MVVLSFFYSQHHGNDHNKLRIMMPVSISIGFVSLLSALFYAGRPNVVLRVPHPL